MSDKHADDVDVSGGMEAVGLVYVDKRGAMTWATLEAKKAFVREIWILMEKQRRAEKKCAKCRRLSHG